MNEEALTRLQQIQRKVLDVQAAMTAMQLHPRPGEERGTDPSGCVAVVVDSGGLPSFIEVTVGWQRHLAAEELARSVLLAFQEAVAEATRVWSESFDFDAWRSRAEAARTEARDGGAPPLHLEQVQPSGGSPDPSALTEEVLRALKTARDQAAAPMTSIGRGGDRAVSITLAPGGLQACTIDSRWAARQGASVLNAALAEALEEARFAMEEQAARRRTEAQGVNDLTREALATLAGFQDLNQLPKER
ncbi:hypothetical protein AB0L86_29865 [Micromonospora musae]|uniref:hypothetical protein n=1 Tax=Micromonospora musae TaxID=1894970 RepID=UPI0034419300